MPAAVILASGRSLAGIALAAANPPGSLMPCDITLLSALTNVGFFVLELLRAISCCSLGAAAVRTNAAIDASLRAEAQTTRLGKIKKTG